MKENHQKVVNSISPLRFFKWRIQGLIIFCSTIGAIIVPQVIRINENQILYYMSSLAQVTAALLGLVLAAYTIADSQLERLDDETVADYVPEMQGEYFLYITQISINSVVTIFLCFFIINFYKELSQKLFSVFIVDTSIMGIIAIVSITLFIWTVCNPKAFEQKGTVEKGEIDKAYAGEQSSDSFRSFLGYYNRLEACITEYASNLLGKNNNYRFQKAHLPIFQALDILLSNEIITRSVYSKIDDFRRYRNALVHNAEPESVNSTIYGELKEVYNLVNKIVTSNEKDKKTYINKLDQYCRDTMFNEFDKKVLDHLSSVESATFSEIVKETNLSKTTISNVMRKLIQAERVCQEKDKYRIIK